MRDTTDACDRGIPCSGACILPSARTSLDLQAHLKRCSCPLSRMMRLQTCDTTPEISTLRAEQLPAANLRYWAGSTDAFDCRSECACLAIIACHAPAGPESMCTRRFSLNMVILFHLRHFTVDGAETGNAKRALMAVRGCTCTHLGEPSADVWTA